MHSGSTPWATTTRRGRWAHSCPKDGGGNLVVTRAQLGIYRDVDEATGKTVAIEVEPSVGCQWCGDLPEELTPIGHYAGMRIPVAPNGDLHLERATTLENDGE